MWNKVKAVVVGVGGLVMLYITGSLAGRTLGEIVGNLWAKD